MTPRTIYVAGASADLALVESACAPLRAAGWQITHDWCAVIRDAGDANPRGATVEQLAEWATADCRGVRRAGVFWLLIPTAPSIGCWVELGVALERTPVTIVSGDWRRTIFGALASHRFDRHDDALASLIAGMP